MTIDYAKLTEQYFKAAGSPVDLRAATLGATTATSDLDKAAASVNFIKACEAVVSLVRHVPNPVGAAIITTSFTVNLLQAVADREAYGYVRPTTRLALIGELYGIGSTLGFAVAIAGGTVVGLSAPLLVAVSGVLATAAIAATFVAASQGVVDKQQEANLVKYAASAAEGLGFYKEFVWLAKADEDAVDVLKRSDPLLYPIVELLHMLCPSLTATEALKVIDATSSTGITIKEAEATLNAIRKLITLQAPVTVTTPEEYLRALNGTFGSIAYDVNRYIIKPWPTDANELTALALTDSEVRKAMVLGTPFLITGPVASSASASDISLYDSVTGLGLTQEWLKDRSTLLIALSASRINENAELAVSSSLPADRSYELRYIDWATGQEKIFFAENTARPRVPMQLVTFGDAGNDTIGGSDSIKFGDHLYGGGGIDTITAGKGDDYVEGNAGNDIIDGGEGNDRLIGGTGNDQLTGGKDSDILIGGEDNDELTAGTGNDVLYGGTGDDTLDGGDGNDFLSGGAGIDTLSGGKNNDYLYDQGGSDKTTLKGDGGNDILEVKGGSGITVMDGGSGNDILKGGAGINTLDGGEGNDVITGGDALDIINGGEGADVIEAGGGADLITGGAGADYMRGGAGDDAYIYDSADFGTDLIEDGTGTLVGKTGGAYDVNSLAYVGGGYEYRKYAMGSLTVLGINAQGDGKNTVCKHYRTRSCSRNILEGCSHKKHMNSLNAAQ